MVAVGVAPSSASFGTWRISPSTKADVKRYESFVRDKIADLLTIAQARARADLLAARRPIGSGICLSLIRSPGGASDPECLALSEALPAPATPDRDPPTTLDLPRAVAADGRRLLVDAQDRIATRRLERDQGDQRLRPRVVVRQHGR